MNNYLSWCVYELSFSYLSISIFNFHEEELLLITYQNSADISFDRVTKIWGFLSKVPLVCCWAGFLAAQKSFDRDWQAVEKVFDANSHVHAFNHWVVTEKKIFPPKKLIQIHLRRRKAIKIDRKRTESLNIIIFVGAKKLYLLLFSQCGFLG